MQVKAKIISTVTALAMMTGFGMVPVVANAADIDESTSLARALTGADDINVQVSIGGDVVAALPDTVTQSYPSGIEVPLSVVWDVSGVDTSKEGTYTATGTATDIYGSQFNLEATVYVGEFTVVNPVSVTVVAGWTLDGVKSIAANATVTGSVKASSDMVLDPDTYPVTWDWGTLADADFATTGEKTVEGTVTAGQSTLPVALTVFVTDAALENVADTGTNLTVNVQQNSKADQWKNLTDGDKASAAWVTWGESGDAALTPTATVNFGSDSREISSMAITYGGNPPASAKAEYTTDGTTWIQLGETVTPSAGQTVTFTAGDPVEVTQVRIVNTVNNGSYMNATQIEVFVTPVTGVLPACSVGTGSLNYWEWMGSNSSAWSSHVAALCNGDKTDKAWSTWLSSGLSLAQKEAQLNPTATFTFGQTKTIQGVTVYYGQENGDRFPGRTIVEYQDASGTWQELGTSDSPSATTTITAPAPVKATAVRIQSPNRDDSSSNWIIVSEIEIDRTFTPQPSDDATLGDLRLDGTTIGGFSPDATGYQGTLSDPGAYPLVQAYAKDSAATLVLVQPSAENDGVATISVTSADGLQTQTTTVDFGSLYQLTGLEVEAGKTEYQIGESLDSSTIEVTAVYQDTSDESVIERRQIDFDDPELSLTGFDSSTAGVKTLTATYRGVTTTFEVTVEAPDVTLADLLVDGETLDAFDPDQTDYSVDLPQDATEYPEVSARATDPSATVAIEQASVDNDGKAIVTVSLEDANDVTHSSVYTVDFGALPTPVPPSSADTLVVRRGNRYYFKNSLSGGTADRVVAYGKPSDTVLVGDWDGDGVDTLAVKRGNRYYIKNSLSGGAADTVVVYGKPSDTALVGDWDGDGSDTLALKRGNAYYLKDTLSGGAADRVVVYGRASDTPLAGDWDGDGVDTLALKRGNRYHLKNSLSGGAADQVVVYGKPSDTALVGDWDGDGSDTLALKRGNAYYLKNTLAGGGADKVLAYGTSSDTPLAGCWLR